MCYEYLRMGLRKDFIGITTPLSSWRVLVIKLIMLINVNTLIIGTIMSSNQ